MSMVDEPERLKSAAHDFERDADNDFVDPKRLAAVIDLLQGKLCRVLDQAKKRGDHLLAGQTACAWVSVTCLMSRTAAADRLCVGEQLGHLPRIAAALSSGQIGYQATAVICHLSEQVGEKREYIDQEHWIDYAQRFSIKDLRYLTYKAREVWDAEGLEKDNEEDYERRYLHLSELGRMYKLDALLDPPGAAALRAAIDSLNKPLGEDDVRSPKQRRADALVEIVHHALDRGTLPRRNGVRPHINVNTSIEALTAELGAAFTSRWPGRSARSAGRGRPSSITECRSRARRCSGWPATAPCAGSSRRTRWWSMWAGRHGRSRRRSGEPSRLGIATARRPGVTGRSTGPVPITSSSGPAAEKATSPTFSLFVTSTIGRYTKADGRWSGPARE